MAVNELLTLLAEHSLCIVSVCSASYFVFEGETLVQFATNLCHCLPFAYLSNLLQQSSNGVLG